VNGAESVLRTLAEAGVRACFANPGTSEMHMVAGLEWVPEIRPVLVLFEGVASGAADGYGRMADVPAVTLLHLGPGLGNAFANLHNARRAGTPVLNIVGDHATFHRHLNAPLTSDIRAVAGAVSKWVRTAESAVSAAGDAAAGLAAAQGVPAGVATLILPADVAWGAAAGPAPAVAPAGPRAASFDALKEAAEVLTSGRRCVLLLGGGVMRAESLQAAGRVAAATGAGLLTDTFSARSERGGGRLRVPRLPYFVEQAQAALADVQCLVVVQTRSPVAFFAYPDMPSNPLPDGCEVRVLATPEEDGAAALAALADLLGADENLQQPELVRPEPPAGGLTPQMVAAAIGALLPEQAIVSDESNTASVYLAAATEAAPPHDWLQLTGGSIGQGLPVATGAAVARADRPVISVEADGSAMYTIQALWTQAREALDVTTVVVANRRYAILDHELQRVGASAVGPAVRGLLDIGRPDLDFARLAESMGVPGTRAEDASSFCRAFRRAVEEPGPHLIEAMV
jgi:acetolactate synthase I/II/III large subunit